MIGIAVIAVPLASRRVVPLISYSVPSIEVVAVVSLLVTVTLAAPWVSATRVPLWSEAASTVQVVVVVMVSPPVTSWPLRVTL